MFLSGLEINLGLLINVFVHNLEEGLPDMPTKGACVPYLY